LKAKSEREDDKEDCQTMKTTDGKKKKIFLPVTDYKPIKKEAGR
jgi:hypothetical protein